MKKLTLISISFYLLSACSHKGTLNVDTFSSADDLKSKTTSKAAYLNIISIEFTPLTSKYIEVKESELGSRNMDSKEVIQKKIAEQKELFTHNKTCFSLLLKNSESLENAHFKNWKFKLTQDSKVFELTPTNTTGVQSVPEVTDSTWINSSYACTTEPIEQNKPFKIYAIPQIKNYLYENIQADFN